MSGADSASSKNRSVLERLRAPRTTVGCDVSPEEAADEIERLRGEAEVADEQLAQLRGFAAKAHPALTALTNGFKFPAEVCGIAREALNEASADETPTEEVRRLRERVAYLEARSAEETPVHEAHATDDEVRACRICTPHRKWPGEPPHCPTCDCGSPERTTALDTTGQPVQNGTPNDA